MAVIRGESCFEKNAFEDTENSHPPTKTWLPKLSKLFFRHILFHGKLSFDNSNYFKLYGNLNADSVSADKLPFILCLSLEAQTRNLLLLGHFELKSLDVAILNTVLRIQNSISSGGFREFVEYLQKIYKKVTEMSNQKPF